ncbi:Gfo/Idh/MocA family protein [Woodsholea maritima]|uniref:Gfo/Idh/MocA family protein n=1 Tax=Woodsholea maritima TaxID=240237 RepID=UPI0003786E19|nr:Gfo/Idh/MocA family oxidoreductase [Woodsholea maritima]
MTHTTSPLRAGVIGAGVFGGYHAAKYAAHERTQFVGVFDPVSDHARNLVEAHGGAAFSSLHDLIDAVDVVTVASPAVFHHDGAKRALLAGKSVLIEKPIAATVEEGEELVELARSKGLIIQIGHQERFVFEAMGLFNKALPKVQALEAHRMGTPSARNLDVSVTLDLMIHDIDLALALAGSEPVKIEADMGENRAGLADHITAFLTFADGSTARLESSRVARDRDRVMSVDFANGDEVEVDFIAKTFKTSNGLPLNPDFAETAMAKDSLGANVDAFIRAALGETTTGASGADGLAAMRTALAIDAAAGSRSRF